MAVAKLAIFNTALVAPSSERDLISGGDKKQKPRALAIQRPRTLDVSTVEQVPVPVSSGEGGEMHIGKTPSSVSRGFSAWSEVNQTWEGRVVENSPEQREFVAIISDRTCRTNPDEEVVIGYESVIESDISLISEGAVFFWNIGKYRQFFDGTGKTGPAVNKYELRFRRLPPVSKETIEEIKSLSKGLSNLIHGH